MGALALSPAIPGELHPVENHAAELGCDSRSWDPGCAPSATSLQPASDPEQRTQPGCAWALGKSITDASWGTHARGHTSGTREGATSEEAEQEGQASILWRSEETTRPDVAVRTVKGPPRTQHGCETETCLERGSGSSGSERWSQDPKPAGTSAVTYGLHPRHVLVKDADSYERALASQCCHGTNGHKLSAQKQRKLIIYLILGSEVGNGAQGAKIKTSAGWRSFRKL